MPSEHDKKVVEELSVAYKTEIEGHAFYKYAAEMTTDEKGKNIFRHLAKDELEHMRVISTIADSLEKGLGWVGYDKALKSKSHGAPILPKESELIRRLKSSQTDLNAVKIGVEAEEKAVEFYSRLLKDAQVAEEKVVLTQLLEMEKGHLKVLRWEAESIAKDGFWCGSMEFSVEKEAD